MTAPHPTLTQWLIDGSDPSGCYCRICGQFAIPKYPGWWEFAVCGQACADELNWRRSLRTMRQPYRRPDPPPPPIPPETPRAPCGGTHTGPCNADCGYYP